MQVTISAISRKEKVSKAGKPFTSLGLKVNEYGDKWLSGFGNKDNASWKVGDTVEVDVEQKGEFLNFSTPKPADKAAETQEKILNAIVGIKLDLSIIKEHVVPKKTGRYADPELNADNRTAFDEPEAEVLDENNEPF